MSPLSVPLLHTQIGAHQPDRQGKVRDIYEFGDRLLVVATDRISAFDYVLGSGIPDKGKVLTQISAFWFEYLRDIVPNHVLSLDPRDYPDEAHAEADKQRADCDAYVDGKLAEFSELLATTLRTVDSGRNHLRAPTGLAGGVGRSSTLYDFQP